MDPQLLLKDEVEFELACRGYEQPGGQVSALKAILKKLMHSESKQKVSYDIKQPRVSKEQPGDELEVCSNKLDVITRYVSELQEKPDRQLYRRLVSRLSHVINRLGFVEAVEELDKERHKILSDKALILLNDLEKKDDLEDDDHITPEMKEALHRSFGEDYKNILVELNENKNVDAATPSSSKSICKPDLEQRRVSFAHDDLDINELNDKFSQPHVFNSTTVHERQDPLQILLAPSAHIRISCK